MTDFKSMFLDINLNLIYFTLSVFLILNQTESELVLISNYFFYEKRVVRVKFC
ncbi:Uncharacterized protein dnm_045590 [Desulfonema magnum]|uniref:Uncharacterized protein n=1 Tax=Desulfonema magnum TaxID=45655 RepID=A0A975GQ27_9BACT|nr:Uncharacterized protein dnm_045590 [Desulfonema magnum]